MIQFDKARAFDFAAIMVLKITIRLTLEYDTRAHRLTGPLLIELLNRPNARNPQQQRLSR